MKSIARDLQRLVEEEEPGTLALVIRTGGSTPGAVGAKMLVLPDGSIRGTVGGGVLEARVISDALNAMEDGKGPRTLTYNLEELGMRCGGEMVVYLEPIVSPKRVVIYGGGHVGTAVARLLRTLGCRITVVDEREEWANRERLPDIEEIVNKPFAEALAAQPPGPKDHVIIVTRGHEHDQQILESVIERRPAYLGMIGSRRKVALMRQEFIAGGTTTPAEFDRIHAPIGLDLGAETVPEIAASIVAELISVRRQGAP
jgi:xanthine dehydrogenase accessory factor